MPLLSGDALAWFRTAGLSNPSFVFDTVAGRYLVLVVLSHCSAEDVRAGVDLMLAAQGFDDIHASLFGLLPDEPKWRASVADRVPGRRWLFDTADVRNTLDLPPGPQWILLDPQLRVVSITGPEGAEEMLVELARLPSPDLHSGQKTPAPILTLPRVFEPELCRHLIDYYERIGGTESGFMREIDGRTRLITDPGHKRRSDVMVEDEATIKMTRVRLHRRLAPMIARAFQFQATRVERYLVACYDADSGGHFRPHRDNTTKGTAHRRFAVSINLNADFEGGDLRFPEFGSRTYRPPVGGAVVFSCSILHEATPVTAGKRYAFLPFLYDEAGARIREQNLGFIDPPQTKAN